MESSLKRYQEILERDTNSTLRLAFLITTVLGISATIPLFLMERYGVTHGLTIPTLWAFAGGFISFVIHMLARYGLIRGYIRYLVVIFMVSMPTTIYVAAYFLLPSGTATYITGPPSYIYFVFIIMSGFFFNRNIAIFAGAITTIEYTLVFFADFDKLRLLSHPDPLLLQDFTLTPIYMFKAQMMLFSGFVVGVLADHMRKLIDSILKEEQDKNTMEGLFGQYVSPEVKDRILSRMDTQGEKKKIAILFSDIRSFSSISERLPPEAMVVQLNEYLNRMVHCVQSRGGVVDKFIGDAVMATFGGLLDLSNPCESALQSALDMLRELKTLNREWWEKSWPPFAIGIGIHFGDVLIGSIGSEYKKEFTVIGDAVNTSSRLESLTKEHRFPVLISGDVFDRLEESSRASAVDLGLIEVKGKLQQIQVYGVRESAQ